jgi:hypothetical protein
MYLGKPLSFPLHRDAECADITIFTIPPQLALELDHQDIDFRSQNSAYEKLDADTNVVTHKGHNPCSSASASNGKGPRSVRKRKVAGMENLSNKSQQISTQSTKLSNKFPSKLSREISEIQVKKKPKVAVEDRTSLRDQEEVFNKLPPSLLNSSSGEPNDAVSHEEKIWDSHRILPLNHLEGFSRSSNVIKANKKHNRTALEGKALKQRYCGEADRIQSLVKEHLKLDNYPTFIKIKNKSSGKLEKWKNDQKNDIHRPDLTVASIQNLLEFVTSISTYLILQEISNCMGKEGKIDTRSKSVQEVLNFMNKFWDESMEKKIVLKNKYFHISKVADFLDPSTPMREKSHYNGRALWYATSKEILKYWFNNE